MTRIEIQQQALSLPEQERLELAEELWASVDPRGSVQSLSLPQWQKDLIDERLEASKGDLGLPWHEVKAEVWPSGS